ncbi:recombinase family protein [Micromonospora ureilytica]|uniref:DNA invertase Pin-like site-specific DNA recombinase n=1 Tax=Micromonospora ureilytica TaxID=709868 RepID=A0ABS0JLD5_9ACTN|nr:recombinase family protein [Micromonospora ureilytica]MBG6067866.1 DNA invertase Pin-like site-specific DNA recombinase [Micromonospora ureilytica]
MITARPAAYVRQSSARANKSEASPATQRTATAERAHHDHPGATLRTFEDIDRSGFQAGVVREAYDQMVAAIKAGEITHLYVFYVSRLTRQDPRIALAEWLPLLAGGLTIVSITEGTFGPDNTMDLIHLLLRMDAAHNESKNKSAAVKAAKALARSAGGHVGHAPYGFTTVERMARTPDGDPVAVRALVVDQAEARTMRVATRAVLLGHAVHAVARHFDRRRIPTRGATVGRSRASSAWSDRALTHRLRDPRIAGLPAVLVLDDKGTRIGYRVAYDLSDPHVLPAPDQPIITTDDYWRLQAALTARARSPRHEGDTPALLSSLGILWCECGYRMKARRFIASPALANRDAYMCTAPAGRHSNTISLTALDGWIRMRIDRLINSIDPADEDDTTASILAEATRRYGAATAKPETAAQRAAVAAELADASAALDQQSEALGTASGAAAAALTRAVTVTGARVDALTARLAELDDQVTAKLPLDLWTSSDYGDEQTWWDAATVPDRRDFVTLFVDRITVRRAASKGGRPTKADPWGSVNARVSLDWAGTA